MSISTRASEFHTAGTPLAGRKVIVTGGTTGIGRAIAGLLASEGATIFVFGRHERELLDALASLRTVGSASGTIADVAEPLNLQKVFREAREKLGELDILVANAGLAAEGIADMEDDEWRYVMETNLIGAMACAKAALAWMSEKKRGHIVIIGSMSAERKSEDSSVYVASKSGLRGFAESFHRESAKSGIKVTLIEPGQVGSDMQDQSPRQQRKEIGRHEMLRAEDIAVAVHYAVTQPERCAVTLMQIRPRIEESLM
jgi:NADP-dependent 3-hydroxy acid dehydrogenase YdfG